MKRTLLTLFILALLAAAATAAWWVWRTAPDRVEQVLARFHLLPTPAETDGLVASGTIEADRVAVTTEAGGRIAELLVGEGDSVQSGQVVIRLDSALLEAQIAQAEAAVAVSEAGLSLARAQARPQELRQARAVVDQAEAAREAARQAWLDAQMLRDSPQDLDVQIAAARTAVEVAQHQLGAAQAQAQAADLELDFWGRTVQLLRRGEDISIPIPGGSVITVHIDAASDKLEAANLQWNLASQRTWQAHEAAEEAAESLKSAQQALRHLLEQRENPQQLQAQVDAAEAEFHTAEEAVNVAATRLQAVQQGTSPEQIRLAEAEWEQAQATLEATLARRDKPLLRAPRQGLVVACPFHAGELALPGSTLLEIADLDNMTLTAYVPEHRLDEVQVGQDVRVSVDSFPDRVFLGRVTRLADEAEFTPRRAAAQEDEVQIVFGVQIALPNSDRALKPGMPADAAFPQPEAGS